MNPMWKFLFGNREQEDPGDAAVSEPEMPEDSPSSWESDSMQEEPPGEPLVWLSGSLPQLQSLARAICATEPDIFDLQEDVTAVYRAATEKKRGGFLYVECDGERLTSRRLMSLCDLAYRINPCRGWHWQWRGTYDEEGEESGTYQLTAERIRVTIGPPTAHEKAEAFVTLVEWLDDMLYAPEKRARFGLSPRSTAE